MLGDEELREEAKRLCTKYQKLFSISVSPEPADLKPMELVVDQNKWELNSNKGPARQQTDPKQKEIRVQVAKMLDLEVIQPSQAEYYSQVHLTPKSNGKWRFCIDYRPLNLACKGMGWPIPNIEQMIQRLGQKRAKYYAKIDLTSGYHQAPLARDSRVSTAFITSDGVYEWTRVPMGLKGAPSYFQGELASTVLRGLLYHICELYIDDIIVFGNSKEEFLANVELVFQRLMKHRLTVNPEKCFLGMSEVEFVGHTIDERGMSFSREKIDKVLNIPEPVLGKELKSFLGVAGYFHRHIKDYAGVTKPLTKMIEGYERNRRLIWSEQGRAAFREIKEAINNCPKLFFMDDHSPVFLHTDASDYGIGGYLFQMINGEEVPIAFISKMLDEREERWTTTEKECYAIIYCIKKLEYLLRDRSFTLRTDHKNLIYIDSETSKKVKRWKLFIQEFDFYIEHIPGKENVAADGFSRLLPLPEEQLHHLFEEFSLTKAAYNAIMSVHNGVLGHHGVDRTMDKLIRKGEQWLYMRAHVRQFIRQCPCCQKMSYLKVPIHTHPFTTASYEPMEVIEMDSIGPLPADEDGNKYILVVICCFTRWVSLYPLKDLTAKSCAECLLQHVGTFGTPYRIVTDNGTQFKNELVEELLKLLGVEHLTILAYSHEENAIVERANREIMRHLRGLIFTHNEVSKWSKHYVPLVQRIMNTSRVDSHKAIPAELLFGQAVNLDRGILLPAAAISDKRKALSKWAAEMLKVQKGLMEKAEMAQRRKDDLHIANASPKRTHYGVGEYVLVEYQSTGMGNKPPNKLLPHLKGPLKVVSRKGDKYSLMNLVTKNEEEVHLTRIHPFFYDPNYTSPRDAALRDVLSLFDVERIIDHSGNRKQRSTMDFLCKFTGWGDEYNLWLPYKEVRDIGVLHTYLIQHGMKSLIPDKFKEHYRHM